jgi:hypothetical protein
MSHRKSSINICSMKRPQVTGSQNWRVGGGLEVNLSNLSPGAGFLLKEPSRCFNTSPAQGRHLLLEREALLCLSSSADWDAFLT